MLREGRTMNDFYFTFRSVTGAQRGQRALQKENIRSNLLRAPKSMSANGCGYALTVRSGEERAAAAALGIWGVEYQRVYRMKPDGALEEQRL